DGLVGAVISNGDDFVTSPNARIIPYPPLGGNRDVYIRENLRYGDDDPLQWPQPVIPGYEYLCAIPLPPLDPTENNAIMWWMPQQDDFDEGGVGLSGVGRFRQYSLQRLRDVSSSLLEQSLAEDLSFDHHTQRAADYRDIIRHNLYRLEQYKSSFATMQRGVRHLQRAYLELHALVEWHTTVKFRIAELEQSQATRPCARTIGGFTPSPVVADYLFRGGIRVWLIRPYSELPNVRIRKVCACILPESLIVMKAPFRQLDAIYTGSNFEPKKYTQIMKQAMRHLAYPNPFGAAYIPPNASIGPVRTSHTASNRRRDRQFSASKCVHSSTTESHKPCHVDPHRRTDVKPPGDPGRNKFIQVSSPILPPALPQWATALEISNPLALPSVHSHVNPTDLGYLFPEVPGLAVAKRYEDMLKFWLRHRDMFLYRMTSQDSSALPVPAGEWRDILRLEILGSGTAGTKNAERLTKLTATLQNCLSETVSFVDDIPDVPTWRGLPFNQLTNSHFEEILWEINELNFRFELKALDFRVSSKFEDDDRQSLIEKCFPGCSDRGSLLVVDVADANHGLASNIINDRSTYTHALRKLMLSWGDDVPAILRQEKHPWPVLEFRELEKTMAEFYTRLFFRSFNRPATIPRRLS
ncbi:hypothetical protein BDN72DRAFT_725271, partial [Pluteus cervinus]